MIGLTTAAALVVLRLVHTNLYTKPGTIDPWLYTALMTNFDFTYSHFITTYYASRLPLVLPGYFLNSFLTPQHAYVVVHAVFFLSGALFLYLLVRTLYGARVAVLVYPAILTNAIYINAHSWDYADGFVITYLSGGLYFLASCTGRRTSTRPALAGFFFAAAAMTNLFSTLLVLAAVAAYLFVRCRTDRLAAVARIVVEAAWFMAGSAILLVGCGVFARQHGGRFLFFMPSVQAVSTLRALPRAAVDFGWMLDEPRLLVPVFLAVVVALVWRRRPRTEGERLGLALTVAISVVFLLLAYWEFFRRGNFLIVDYYFDQPFPFFFVMLAAAVFTLLGWASRDVVQSFAALAAIGLVVGAAPLVIVFGIEGTEAWTIDRVKIAAGLMALTLLLVLGVRFGLVRWRTPILALLAGALTITSVGYASAANDTTWSRRTTTGLPDGGDVFTIGIQLIDFMEHNGLQAGALPDFWYDQGDYSLLSVQSLYYYQYTLLSAAMPISDAELRDRLAAVHPTIVVLLCADVVCGGSAAELRRVGTTAVLVAADRLHAGSLSYWVEAYRLDP